MKTQRFLQGPNALSAALVVAALSATGMSAQPEYSFKDLGTLSGLSSKAVGINNAGQVVGESDMPNGATHAFLHSGGYMNDLDTLGGSSSHAYAINNLGQVVGYSDMPGGSLAVHAFRCSGAMMLDASSDLGTLGGGSSVAYAINDAGQVVGYSETGYSDAAGNHLTHAFLFPDPNDPEKMQDLGTLGGFSSWATAINYPGDVVGTSDIHVLGAVFYHAFRYSHGQLQDLGTLGGNSSQAVAVNDLGNIVGNSDTPGNVSTHAFIFPNPDAPTSRMMDLGTLGGSCSLAVAINLPGQVVGTSQIPGNVAQHAFLYPDPNDPTKMKDLGTLGGSSSWATAINDYGIVVGYSEMPGNQTIHAFLYPGPNGNMLDIGPLGGSSSVAVAINENGHVAVTVKTPNNEVEHAFLYPGANGQLQDLGTLRGLNSYGRAINDSGDVVGVSTMPRNILGYIVSNHAFIYSASDGKMKDLGTFGNRWNDGWSLAQALNNGGAVVGASFRSDNPWHAFRYAKDDMMRDLGALNGFWSSYATAINASGTVAGYCVTGDENRSRAFLWPSSTGEMFEIPSLGGSYCEAIGINNTFPGFSVVGRSTIAGDQVWHPFIYTSAYGVHDMGEYIEFSADGRRQTRNVFAPGTDGAATAINDVGFVVGYENSSGPYHAFLARGSLTSSYQTRFKDLKTLGGSASYACDINKVGQVVGYSDMPGDSVQHAFIYYDGVMRDLNELVDAPGWTLWEARGINDREQVQITGTARSPDGWDHAFVLTRISGSGQPAPAIVDTVPPSINSLTVTPDVIGVPAGQMVPMTITALVSDAIDPFPQSSILGVISNQPITAGIDYVITGPLTLSLKCTSASSGTRVYTINVESVDCSGNAAVGSVSTVAAPLPPRPRGR